jgi:hypothetical protein
MRPQPEPETVLQGSAGDRFLGPFSRTVVPIVLLDGDPRRFGYCHRIIHAIPIVLSDGKLTLKVEMEPKTSSRILVPLESNRACLRNAAQREWLSHSNPIPISQDLNDLF